MSEEKEYPSLVEQGKNLAKFSWDLINYIHKNQGSSLMVSDETYKERISTCKGCAMYDDLESRCRECGCFVPAKAKIILDSCPLNKWGADTSGWEEKFSSMMEEIDKKQENN